MHSFVVDSSAFDVVMIAGSDAERFLQGQLTCDVAALADNHWVLGSCCNNKGRVLATFVLVRQGECFSLCMTHGTGAVLIGALKKFLPFYKCTMQLQDGAYQLYGLAGDAAQQQRTRFHAQTDNGALLVATDESGDWLCWLGGQTPRALLWSKAGSAGEAGQDSTLPSAGNLEKWEALGLLQGQYPFRPENSGEYTPQELQLDQNGYVSFTKGCYTGQEIVARLHYRGKPKKQLFLLQLAATPSLGQTDIKGIDGQVVGSLLLYRQLGNSWLALVQLPVAFALSPTQLLCAETTVMAGCAFESTVIQLSSLVFP